MKQHKGAVFVVWLFSSFIFSGGLWYWASTSLTDPTEFTFVLEAKIDPAIDSERFLEKDDIPKYLRKTVSGHFGNPSNDIDFQPYGLISYFSGTLKVFADGFKIFEADSDPSLSHSSSAYFIIPLDEGGQMPDLTFELSGTEFRYVRTSDLHIADLGTVLNASKDLLNTTQFLKFSTFGVTICIFFAVLGLVATGAMTISAGIPSLVIASFIAIPSYTSVSLSSTNFALTILPISAAPVLLVNLWLLRRVISSEGSEIKLKQKNMQLLALSLSVILVLVGFFTQTDIRWLGRFVNGPLLLIGLWGIVLFDFIDMIKRPSITVMLFGVAIATFATAVTHDFGMRFGYGEEDRYISGLGSVIFVFVVSLSFIRGTFDMTRRLEAANIVLERALADKTAELERFFDSKAEVLRAGGRAIEKARMQQDLHDGVLAYLSIISVLTESARKGKLTKINQCSRMAINEIRMIIDTEGSVETSLLVAIASLRRHFVDRLSDLQIVVEVDVIDLIDLNDMEYQVVLETIRILQESIHNAAFRGNCRNLSIVAKVRGEKSVKNSGYEGFSIVVSNSGGRPLREKQLEGNGIRNMRVRAARIGASLAIICREDGAIVELTWPSPLLSQNFRFPA